MASSTALRYIDSDGHILEHPTAMPDYAPAEYRDRIWHIETDDDGEEWLVYDGNRTPGERHGGGRRRRHERRRSRRARSGARCATRRPVPRAGTPRPASRTWTRTTSTSRCCTRRCCSGSRASTTSTSPMRRPSAYNDWCSDHVAGGRGPPVRRRRGARRCTKPTTSSAVAAEIRRVADAARAWCRCSCARTRRSTGGRSTTRSTTRSGRRPPTPGSRSRCTRSSSPTSPGACMGLRLGRPRKPDGSYVDDFDPEHQLEHAEQLRASGAARDHPLHPGDREPVRRDELHRVPHRRRRVRALPRREVHLPGGQRRLARPVARAPRPPLPQVPVGGRRPVDAAVGVHQPAVLDQLRPRRGDARA